ncbi:MAG: beta-CASP ribonuclease aCPSF1, partial [Euryarchaeota archaeon]|nr:beta-CASP ribonuclease aCPSF1 [Euryarchaeota archaeon]
MAVQETLTEIKKAVKDNVPSTALVTKVDFEGPGVVLYSKNPSVLAADGNIIKDLARIIRKRIIVRPDPSVLTKEEEAIEKIKAVVPEDAGITNIQFDPNFGEAIIEAVKPGLVIGKSGKTLSEIKMAVGWTPRVTRTPPIKSKIVESVRRITIQKSDERKELLRRVGKRIHRAPMVRGGYWIRVSALGGFREVGRSSIYLHTPESKVLVDCGVNVAAQEKDKIFPYLNVPEFKLQELDAVVITHAHLDHCGFLPYLFYMGYEGPVYCTPPTRDLMFLLQWDYLDVAEREGKELPYPRKFVKKVVNHVIPLEYGEVTDISPDIRLTLHNAGHILGSSIAHFHMGDGLYNLAYTGDLKFERSRLFEPANIRFPRLETLITESTYGSAKDIQPPRKKAEQHLLDVVNETIAAGGKAIVPVFAVGRAQELMVSLADYMKRGAITEVPVYLDGMIWEATGIHTTYPEYLNRQLRDRIFHKGDNPFLSEVFEQVSGPPMRQEIIDGDEPAIILATSGMLAGGPIMEYFRALAEDYKNSIIFVGYQSEGSMGRRVQKGWRELPVQENGKTRVIPINMQVHTIDGFSGHSDRNQLINYIRRLNSKPERILTCHGEESKCIELASVLYKTFKSETRAPYNL